MCPGKNDSTVRNAKRSAEKLQKRLLLCNVREAYLFFKKKFPVDKVGFSSICELRPKQCITVGQSGSNACVCKYHQYLKLMLSVVHPSWYYQDLMKMCVSNITNRECKLGTCENCPGFDEATNFITDKATKILEKAIIQFKPWGKRLNRILVIYLITSFTNTKNSMSWQKRKTFLQINVL